MSYSEERKKKKKRKEKKKNLVPVVHETTKNKHLMTSANDGERCFTRTFTIGNNYQHSGFSCPVLDRLHNLYGRKLCTEDNVTCDFVVL